MSKKDMSTKEDFKKYIKSKFDEIENDISSNILNERRRIWEEAAATGTYYGGGVVGKLIESEKKGIEDVLRQIIETIEKDIKEYPDIYYNQDFDAIYLVGDNSLQNMFLKSYHYLKNIAKERNISGNITSEIGLFTDDCKQKLRKKLEQISLKLSLSMQKHLLINEVDELNKVKEIINRWNCCKDCKKILTKQIDNFINSDLTSENLTSIYRTAIPEIESIMREIAKENKIKKKIKNLGRGIDILRENDLLSDEALALLHIIQDPFRDIGTHGLKIPILVLKLLCLSSFESVRFLYESKK